MSKLDFISKLPDKVVQELIKSVDTVLFDVDGVLVHNKLVLPGSDDAVAKLRKLGKKIGFVTNDSFSPINYLKAKLDPFGAETKDIITPNTSLLWYLEINGFNKDIFVISNEFPKQLLRKKGYNVIEYKDIQPTQLEVTLVQMKELSLRTVELCKNVGIVYVDLDFNCQWGAMQAAKIILNHMNDVQLLCGLSDEFLPLDNTFRAIGGKYYLDGIEQCTNRKAVAMCKPGQILTDVVISKFGISDRSRVLMIGDNPKTDIAFGINSGFKTCLTLTGVTKKSEVENWKLPEDFKPDYVASSLGEIYEKIKNM